MNTVRGTVCGQGIDTLVIGYSMKGQLKDYIQELLSISKEEAKQPGMQGDFPLNINGVDGVVLAYGNQGYEHIFKNDDFCVRFASEFEEGRVFPEVMIDYRSQFLWREGPEKAVQKVNTWLSNLGAEIVGEKVSRIDLCLDMREDLPIMASTDQRIQGRMKKKKDFAGTAYSNGRLQTGYQMGAGNIVARMYNKTHEINISNKTWMKDIWSKHGWQQGDQVTRVEFQLRREAVKNFTGKENSTFKDVLKILPDIWRYCSHEWFTLHQENKSDSNYRRWKLSEMWLVVQSAVFLLGELTGVTRLKQVRPKVDKLLAMAKGVMTSIVALEKDKNNLLRQLQDTVNGSDFDVNVQARQMRFGIV